MSNVEKGIAGFGDATLRKVFRNISFSELSLNGLYVCKRWASLIQDDIFLKKYFSVQNIIEGKDLYQRAYGTYSVFCFSTLKAADSLFNRRVIQLKDFSGENAFNDISFWVYQKLLRIIEGHYSKNDLYLALKTSKFDDQPDDFPELAFYRFLKITISRMGEEKRSILTQYFIEGYLSLSDFVEGGKNHEGGIVLFPSSLCDGRNYEVLLDSAFFSIIKDHGKLSAKEIVNLIAISPVVIDDGGAPPWNPDDEVDDLMLFYHHLRKVIIDMGLKLDLFMSFKREDMKFNVLEEVLDSQLITAEEINIEPDGMPYPPVFLRRAVGMLSDGVITKSFFLSGKAEFFMPFYEEQNNLFLELYLGFIRKLKQDEKSQYLDNMMNYFNDMMVFFTTPYAGFYELSIQAAPFDEASEIAPFYVTQQRLMQQDIYSVEVLIDLFYYLVGKSEQMKAVPKDQRNYLSFCFRVFCEGRLLTIKNREDLDAFVDFYKSTHDFIYQDNFYRSFFESEIGKILLIMYDVTFEKIDEDAYFKKIEELFGVALDHEQINDIFEICCCFMKHMSPAFFMQNGLGMLDDFIIFLKRFWKEEEVLSENEIAYHIPFYAMRFFIKEERNIESFSAYLTDLEHLITHPVMMRYFDFMDSSDDNIEGLELHLLYYMMTSILKGHIKMKNLKYLISYQERNDISLANLDDRSLAFLNRFREESFEDVLSGKLTLKVWLEGG